MTDWQQRNRPKRLERRFEFDGYESTRDFLEGLGVLSEASKVFPDISFGKTYVNITLRPESEKEDAELTDKDYKFASDVDGLLD